MGSGYLLGRLRLAGLTSIKGKFNGIEMAGSKASGLQFIRRGCSTSVRDVTRMIIMMASSFVHVP